MDSSAPPSAGRDQPRLSEDVYRPSDDSSKGLLKAAPRPMEPRISNSNAPEGYIARLEFDRPHDEVPPRHPSRQMMRWGPPPSEYGWDDRDDRRGYGRASYDYGAPRHGPMPADYYSEDPAYNRPYRRAPSVREPPTRWESNRGPPPSSRKPRRRADWHDPSEDESEAETSRHRKRTGGDGGGGRDGGSPPPSEILRLPFTMWMNSSIKNRMYAIERLSSVF